MKMVKKILHQLNIVAQCRQMSELGLSPWSCPQLVFLVMGTVIIFTIVLTYRITQVYVSPEIVALIVLLVSFFLFVVSYVLVNAFEKVVYKSQEESQRSREVIKLKDQFLFFAAHELRTPASAIRWSVDMLKPAIQTLSNDEKETLSIIEQSNDRLLSLVEDILETARIENSTIKIDLSPVSAESALKTALKELNSDIEVKGVSIGTDISADSFVYADSLRLKEIFVNLISNAIKYSDSKNSKVKVAGANSNGWFVVTITNNGQGIGPEEQQHVFEKFWRSQSFVGVSGTGLGLFIVRQLVELMSGKIWFYSRPGETSFSVAFKKSVSDADKKS